MPSKLKILLDRQMAKRLSKPRKRNLTYGNQGRVFAYWTGDNEDHISEFHQHWSRSFNEFKVFDDEDVIPILRTHFSDKYVNLFNDIKIPAAKSDVARLLLLYHWGGLYVDCHCGMVDTDDICKNLSELERYDAIFLDRRLMQEARPSEEHYVINSIMFGKKGTTLFLDIVLKALYNLECQRELELRGGGFSPYHVAALSGPNILNEMILRPMSMNRQLRTDYESKIKIVREESAPVERNVFRSYNRNGTHWSQTQLKTPLFEPLKK